MGRDIVLAKSTSLCFRLTAKTRSAPLLVLSPRKAFRLPWGPLREPRRGTRIFQDTRLTEQVAGGPVAGGVLFELRHGLLALFGGICLLYTSDAADD